MNIEAKDKIKKLLQLKFNYTETYSSAMKEKKIILEYIDFLEKFSKSYSEDLYNNFQELRKEFSTIDDDLKKTYEEKVETYSLNVKLENSIFQEMERFLVEKETKVAEEKGTNRQETLEILKGHPIFISFNSIQDCMENKNNIIKLMMAQVKKYNKINSELGSIARKDNISEEDIAVEMKLLSNKNKHNITGVVRS